MKTLFIEAKYNNPIALSKGLAGRLEANIGLVSSIQFLDSLPSIKDSLTKKQINPKIKKVIIAGQILGCNAENAAKIKDSVDFFLYIGDGSFHPLAVALETKKPVYKYNPLNNQLTKIEQKDIENYERRKKAAMLKFLSSDVIGILVSKKKGQYYNIKKLTNLEKKYPKKKFYIFIADTIDYSQMENFPFIQAWVNTACPRIEEDIKIINIKEIS
ncbi:MAG: 2-(3-amino-3-carboxypropyl)histidine synthase subunit [Nanoarchaeota archaeon]|nr:2-(3-amino-3-carboxypropyl)histidine synthase subunit [Nanoarchaeota archaeon]